MKLYHFKRLLVVCLVLFPFISNTFAQSLDDARRDYLFGDFQSALRIAQKLKLTDEVGYFIGLTYLKLGDYTRSRTYFDNLIKRYPDSMFYAQSMVKLADTYFLEKNYEKAESIYEQIKRKKPLSDYLPLVYLRLSQIASKQGRWDVKDKYMKLIEKNYPNSTEARFVKVLESYGNFFTVQVGAFSKEENAFSIKKELDRKYAVYIVKESRGEYTLYKVRVGKFKNRNTAEKIRLVLLEAGYPAVIYP